jgi:hypothetical protein
VKTFKVIKWEKPKENEGDEPIFKFVFDCPQCGREAVMPHVGRPFIIATRGLGFIYEPGHKPPAGTFPQVIQCRGCRKHYES